MIVKRCKSCNFLMPVEEYHCVTCGRLQDDEFTLRISKGDSVQTVRWEFTDESMKKHTVSAIKINEVIYHFGEERID